MQPVSSADAAAVGAAVAVAGVGVGAGGTGAVAGTRAVTGSRSVASDHNAGERDHSKIITTPADPDPAKAKATNNFSTTSKPSTPTTTAAAGVSDIDSGGIASIGLSPVVAPLLRSGQHHHHPSESTSYTDYSDYSDYSYDDYDDDEDYDEEYDEDGGTRYQVHEDLDEDDDEDEDSPVLRQGPQDPEVIIVDFDPDCLRYILGFYDEAKRVGDRARLQRLQSERAKQLQRLQRQKQQLQISLEARIGDHSRDPGGASSSPAKTQRNPLVSYSSTSSSATSSSDLPAALNSLAPQDPLQDKQAIIVLREELDYFAIPPPSPAAIANQDRSKPAPAAAATNVVLKSTATTTKAKSESENDNGDDSASSSRQSVEEEPPLLGRTPSMTAASVAATLKAKMFSSGKGKGKETKQPAVKSKAADPRAPSPPPPPPPPKDFTFSSSPLLWAAGSRSASNRVPSPPLPPMPSSSPLLIKTQCGELLVNERRIFAALQRNIEKAKNKAEQHLMDMLCVSGFDRQGEWGYRQLQPQRTTVISVAMVTLKTTASSPTIPESTVSSASNGPDASASSSSSTKKVQPEGEILEQMRLQEQMDKNQMAIAQKLLLFWRKPAVSRFLSKRAPFHLDRLVFQ